jgi:crotonobetainyl-CoA:carnitine CoA-transferase CaiB-like acyl-CoA transferase
MPELPAAVTITGPPEPLRSVFPITAFATDAIASSLAAAAELRATRNSTAVPGVTLDTRHVATAIRSERFLRVDGAPSGAGFAPLSRFWRTADGWIRTHANYEWHRDRMLRALRTPDDPEAVGAAVARWPAADLEEAIIAAGGCAAAVRTADEWHAHPQGVVLDVLGLLETSRIGEAAPRVRAPAPRALDGVRVLDLTRVIAGPVCTRTLAAHGADVLRVDTPALPEIEAQAIDALVGKRSAFVDLRSPVGDAELEHLLDDVDVVVTGYRPGALHQFGLAPAALADRHPGIVVVNLSAWGHEGPWAGRRGFDSLVQAACGIALAEARGAEEPGVLPAQALDHTTGYLAAAAAMVAVHRQLREGDTWLVQCSLAQTAAWLLRQARLDPPTEQSRATEIDPGRYLVDLPRAGDVVTIVTPPGAIDGAALTWPSPPAHYGASPPRWRGAAPVPTWAGSG